MHRINQASINVFATRIAALGPSGRLQIVAEGVETEAQRQFLQDAGCDLFQGYLYAPALGAAAYQAAVLA